MRTVVPIPTGGALACPRSHERPVRRRDGLARATAAGLLAAAAVASLDAFRPAGIVADGFVDLLHALPLGAGREPAVLVVELGPPRPGTLARVARLLADARPLAIAVSAPGEPPSELAALEAGGFRAPLVVVDPLRPSAAEAGLFEPAAAGETRRGALVVPMADDGLVRAVPWEVRTRAGLRASLEARVAEAISVRRRGSGPLRLDLRGVFDEPPRLAAERVSSEEIPPGLARGKVVLLARTAGGVALVPVAGTPRPMDDLALHGLALDTVARGSEYVELPRPILGLLFVSLGLASALFLRRRDPGRAVAVVLAAAAGHALLAALLLAGAGLLWPAVSLASVHALAALGAQLARSVRHRRRLLKLVLESGRTVVPTPEAPPRTDTEAFWQGFDAMVGQFVEPRRSVLLLRNGSGPHATEVRALGCAPTALRERRRAFRRSPFSQAVRTGGPVHVAPGLLMPPLPGEDQYLVPLAAEGEVEGFWAIGLRASPDGDGEKAALGPLSHALAAMLRGRRVGPRAAPPASCFEAPDGDEALRELERRTARIRRDARLLGSVLERIESPALVASLSGGVLLANPPMRVLLSRRGIDLGDASLATLVARLSGASLAVAREALRPVLSRRPSRLAAAGGPGRPAATIHLKPLDVEPADLAVPGPALVVEVVADEPVASSRPYDGSAVRLVGERIAAAGK